MLGRTIEIFLLKHYRGKAEEVSPLLSPKRCMFAEYTLNSYTDLNCSPLVVVPDDEQRMSDAQSDAGRSQINIHLTC
ncbi:hypothetical protein RRG08_008905 [Elysia crispata]|uniref:Uncharacterized protein n=1 Tax=Elysia crispata TaxID=231223 RepID=A0AAE1DPL6_9GAST|nr:hypothetical protein RRG08_008905 [Elysia crispata]